MSGAEPFILAASTVMSTVGAISSANAEAAAAKRDAQIAERNRTLAQQDAIQATRTADIAAEDQARDNRRQLAQMRAEMGASGLEFSGSPVDVLADTSIEMALDQRRITYEGVVRGREGAIEAQNYADQAAASRQKAKNARAAGYYSAGTAFLSGGSKTYSSFEQNKYF